MKSVSDDSQGPIKSDKIVASVFAKFGFDARIEKVFEAWDSLDKNLKPAGCEIKMVGAKKGIVYIAAQSSSAKHKIFHTRNKIIAALNNFIGGSYIKDIVVDFSDDGKK